MQLLFYISGHGYGHATRSSEVLREIARQQPDWRLHVRSNVPERLFAGIDRLTFHRLPESLDPGVVEDADSLGIDVAATLDEIERYHRRRLQIIDTEVAWVRSQKIALIVADFPPLAGEIAAVCGVPCVGVGNFTWDWIYEPLFEHDERQFLQAWLRGGYRKMHCWLKLPFSHEENGDVFPRVVDVPLVARRPRRPAAAVLEQLGIDAGDLRPRVVLAMRGRIPPAARDAAVKGNQDLLFLHFDAADTGQPNEIGVTLSVDLAFPDVLNVADVVVSKFGYGMVSECIAARKRLLCPPRLNFREDEIFAGEAPAQLRLKMISQADFRAGRWSQPLRWLLDQPVLESTLPIDGAAVCAREIARIAASHVPA
ncbi:MAG TPA: hypothetical protein VJ783_21490 [Pirellulales bacterium]|nr:hypothetical protein [Pirellulales bacterium]